MLGGASWTEEFIHIPLASRTGAITGGHIRPGPTRGALFILHVKTAGTSTLTFRVSAVSPMENQGYVPTANVVVSTAGTYVIAIGPGVAAQPPGEGADTVNGTVVVQTVAIPLPGIFRAGIIKGDASAWEFGVAVRKIR